MFEYQDPGSMHMYEAEAVAKAEEQEQREAEERYANKISGHEQTLDDTDQLSLW